MTRSWVLVHGLVAVVLLALILVHDLDANWCAQCDAELRARLNLDAILFISRGRDCRLAGSPARHLWLDVGFSEGHARGAAVDDGADTEAVGFAIARACQSARVDCAEGLAYVVTL